MSIRERTREVAVLKTLGFTRGTILGLYVGEAMTVAVIGGICGSLFAFAMVAILAKAPGIGLFFGECRSPGNAGGCDPGVCTGRISECHRPVVSRSENRHRGGLALHRLASSFMAIPIAYNISQSKTS